MDTKRIPPAGAAFQTAHEKDTHPHPCNSGWVTIGQMVLDPETGEEVEEHALYLCRRCAERS